MRRTASISDDGLYRFALGRQWATPVDGGRIAVFIMLNPSTADDEEDDPTIRRCIGFAEREGCDGLVVVNLSPFRSTDPTGIGDRVEPGEVNARNSREIREAFDLARSSGGIVIAAWGAAVEGSPKLATRVSMIRATARSVDLGLCALGTPTKDGHPRHPLYLAGDAPLYAWPAPREPTEPDKQWRPKREGQS